jgi:SAM-dependent methyltransferase
VPVEFAVGDVYALDAANDSFDVVHAHQVLQHLTDPVAALREMARVCRPGGVLAVRDVDYATFTWFPDDEGLDRWLDLYHRVTRHNGAEPDAGRRLLGWAHAAGAARRHRDRRRLVSRVGGRAGVVGSSWAGRATASSFAEQALAHGLATRDELEQVACRLAALGRGRRRLARDAARELLIRV